LGFVPRSRTVFCRPVPNQRYDSPSFPSLYASPALTPSRHHAGGGVRLVDDADVVLARCALRALQPRAVVPFSLPFTPGPSPPPQVNKHPPLLALR
jgi:hypothetical protein